jgi:hypothetical protein
VRRLLALVGTVEAIAWYHRIECREATTGEIMKFFTGRASHGGRATKKLRTIEMCRCYGWDVGADDDAADALALWAMAEAIVNPTAASRRGDGVLFLPRNERAPEVATPGAQRNHKRRGPSSYGQPVFI